GRGGREGPRDHAGGGFDGDPTRRPAGRARGPRRARVRRRLGGDPVIRLLLAAAVALGIAIMGTKALIEFLVRNRIGQPIREDGPQGHFTKAGTPTMGGVAIVGAATVGYVLSDL